jgi:hypothetical protein
VKNIVADAPPDHVILATHQALPAASSKLPAVRSILQEWLSLERACMSIQAILQAPWRRVCDEETTRDMHKAFSGPLCLSCKRHVRSIAFG